MPRHYLSRRTLALSAFVLGLLLAIGMAGGALYAYYRAQSRRRPPSPPPPPVYARQEFSRRILGKTEDEAIAAVGRPDETSVEKDGTYWHYKKRTRDPLTQEEDSDVQVIIKEGKVATINY